MQDTDENLSGGGRELGVRGALEIRLPFFFPQEDSAKCPIIIKFDTESK